jgi:hypothetical protein
MGYLTQTISTVSPNGDDAIVLTPNDRRSVFYTPALGNNSTYDLVIESTHCEIGDQVVLILTNVPTESFILNVPENVIYTFCGHTDSDFTISGVWVIDLYYNGSHFVNTLDLG